MDEYSKSLRVKYRWYVYQLIDPRDGSVFYVGKGQKNRIVAHEKEAAKSVCSRKTKRIRDIWDSNLEVIREKVALFSDEQLAYDFETEVIDSIGLHNLTNVHPGGVGSWSLRQAELKAKKAKPAAPIAPLDFVKEVTRLKDSVFVALADWLSMGGHKGKKFSVVANDGVSTTSINAKLTEISLNRACPFIWDLIVKNKETWAYVCQRLADHGIDLRFGNGCSQAKSCAV